MASHPLDGVLTIAWYYPRPGIVPREPYAEIRFMPIGGKWMFRVVTCDEPRNLVGDYRTLLEAARGAHSHAIIAVTPASHLGMYENRVGH